MNCSTGVTESTKKSPEIDAHDDETFFKVLDRADIEGRVLDVSYVQKTVVVLTSVTSEGGVTVTSDALKYTGDQGKDKRWPKGDIHE